MIDAAKPPAALLEELQRALRERSRANVNEAARQLLAIEAPLGVQWRSLVPALVRNGELGLAMAAIDRFVAATGDQPQARFERALLLAQCGRLLGAEAEMAAIPTEVPDPASHAYLRGTLALNRGEPATAFEQFNEVLRWRPASGQAWLAISELKDLRSEPDLRSALERAWQSSTGDEAERVQLAYAAGRMYHHCGDHSAAFAAFRQGAAIRRGGAVKRIAPNRAAISTSFPMDLVQRIASKVTVDHRRATFVTGLPRSGSTLVEQILTSHSEFGGRGEELGFVPILAQEIGGLDGASVTRWLDRGGEPDALVSLYLHLASERFGSDGRFVDKTLEAGTHLGLILALFPSAPIIWCRREPLDCGWSAFRTYFARGVDWSWDLADIGRRLAEEDAIFRHWQALAPERVAVIQYERLVTDPAAHIEQIARAAGVPFESAMQEPHRNARSVTTASVSQVRRPISSGSVGAAQPYRGWLQPMADAYRSGSVNTRSSVSF